MQPKKNLTQNVSIVGCNFITYFPCHHPIWNLMRHDSPNHIEPQQIGLKVYTSDIYNSCWQVVIFKEISSSSGYQWPLELNDLILFLVPLTPCLAKASSERVHLNPKNSPIQQVEWGRVIPIAELKSYRLPEDLVGYLFSLVCLVDSSRFWV